MVSMATSSGEARAIGTLAMLGLFEHRRTLR